MKKKPRKNKLSKKEKQEKRVKNLYMSLSKADKELSDRYEKLRK